MDTHERNAMSHTEVLFFSLYLKYPTFICFRLDHYLALRDVQTATMLACVFGTKTEPQNATYSRKSRPEMNNVSVDIIFMFFVSSDDCQFQLCLETLRYFQY